MFALMLLPLAAAAVATPPPRAAQVAVDEDGTPLPRAVRTQVDVILRGPQGILWSGPLLVGAQGQTSWRLTVSEPADPSCGPLFGYSGEGSELSITLQPLSNSTWDGEMVSVVTRWTRRGDERCAGIRGVDLRESVRLPPSGMVTLRGDGGFVVELRRR